MLVFALLLTNVMSGHTLPATDPIPGPGDPKAKVLLDSICGYYETFKSMKVDMVLTSSFRSSIKTDTIRGFVEGEKYRLEMPKQDVVHDGKKVWFHDKTVNKIFNKENNPQETNFLYPSRTLKNWENQFDYSIVGELDLGERTFLKMEFTSKSKGLGNTPAPKINMFVDKRNFQILKITVLQSNGDFLMLDYHNLAPNIKFDSAIFVLGIS